MTISRDRGTMGVRKMPDGLDSGNCHMGHNTDAVVRVNLDGIWTSLCQEHLDELLLALMFPAEAPPKPKVRSTVDHRHPWGEDEYDLGCDYR